MRGHLPILGALACSACLAAPLGVDIVSPRAGLTFTDSEPVDVRARIHGATAPVTVEYTVRETDGPWQSRGQVRIDALTEGTGEAPLPLDLPGRGLYALSVEVRLGDEEARLEKSLGVVFTPAAVSANSPWGIFYIPYTWPGKDHDEGYRDIARSIRLLGASWVRFNFWAGTFGKITLTPGEPAQVSADWSAATSMVRALREEGLFILGEISQCPRELSSRPDDTEVVGDAGPVYNRVKPANYVLWEQLMEKLARGFADDIPVWEIWNEANLSNVYWTGTVEDFAELVKRTAAGLRRGNPATRIAAAGFVGGHDFADRCFALGMGKDIDILSVHYTDESPHWIDAWKALMAKHDLSLPIWNSEERSEVPVRNIQGGIERSFKFCHINIGYEAFRLLVNRDLTPRAPGIWASVGAHCLGEADWVGRDLSLPGYDLQFFQRGEERIAAITRFGNAGKLFTAARRAQFRVAPLLPGQPVIVTDALGRSRTLEIRGGIAELALEGNTFVNGAHALEVVSAAAQIEPGIVVAEAETAAHSQAWSATSHPGFSEGETLDIWTADDPGADGHWVEVKITAPEAGRYEVLFSGNSLERLAAPRSLSPFVWRLDGGQDYAADNALPVTRDVPGAPEGLSTLGAVDLAAGEHVFRLKLSARRDGPDNHWALWFDAIALRRVPAAE